MKWLLAFVLASAHGAEPPDRIVIFVVEEDPENEQRVTLEPIVMLSGTSPAGQKVVRTKNDPVPPDSPETAYTEFERTFFARGAEYVTFQGGERGGRVRITSSYIVGADGGCQALSGTATLLDGPRKGLAVSYDIFKGHPNRRRAASVEEQKRFLEAARRWLRDYGLDPGLVSSASLAEIVATELRANLPALIGRVDLKAPSAEHRLFLFVEKGESSASWAILDTKQDLEDGTDESLRTFVDQIDFDGDGVDEVVLKTQHYESWDYSIVANTGRGGWYRAFTGGGGGC